MEVEDTVVQKMRERYSHVHPWIFHRSCAYATSPGDLFDILEGLPQTYPIVWDDKNRQWATVEDIRVLNLKD